ncbi:hypothetical protein ACJMK2_020006 [Sinanodonta woodiana]|uniref:LolA-like domain-containing protein n=1 Tax=Sinanodonta woodiana TaxID=1069815 RepID=A0ABD3TYL6_SINWO
MTVDIIHQLPPIGVFCPGRMNQQPINSIPQSFGATLEIIDQDFKTIRYENIWFNAEKKLVRRDYKLAQGTDPDPSSDIYDFNLGIHYSIDPYTGSCVGPSLSNIGDLFVDETLRKDLIRMQSAESYFHIAGAQIQYVGKNGWTEAVDLVLQPGSLFRMDLWLGGSTNAVINNVLQFNSYSPPQSIFNVAPCYQSQNKTRVLFHFVVYGNKTDLDQVSREFLMEKLHTEIIKKAFLHPLRLTEALVQIVGQNDVYFAATLLDLSPLVNSKLYYPTGDQHSLDLAFDFLRAAMEGDWTVTVVNTLNENITLHSQELKRIDYFNEFTKTTPQTTTTPLTPFIPPFSIKIPTPPVLTTTPELTPPPPDNPTVTPILTPPPPGKATSTTSKSSLPTSKSPFPTSKSPFPTSKSTHTTSKPLLTTTQTPSMSSKPTRKHVPYLSGSTSKPRQSAAQNSTPCHTTCVPCPQITSCPNVIKSTCPPCPKLTLCPTLPPTTTSKITCPKIPTQSGTVGPPLQSTGSFSTSTHSVKDPQHQQQKSGSSSGSSSGLSGGKISTLSELQFQVKVDCYSEELVYSWIKKFSELEDQGISIEK